MSARMANAVRTRISTTIDDTKGSSCEHEEEELLCVVVGGVCTAALIESGSYKVRVNVLSDGTFLMI